MLKGKELVKSSLDNIPGLPGVYQMLAADNQIIYVGKAKNLRNRLSQYLLELTIKNELMISLTHLINYQITESESAALILEGELIKKFKPRFNILLKDDKSFPYIKLRLDHQYPQLLKYRGRDMANGKFFGPFASVKDVELTLIELQKIFRLRSCTDNYFSTRKRPCIQYQIKRCSAPCTGKITKIEYDELVNQVKSFLSGKNLELQKILSEKMSELSGELKFEKAAEIRDRIKALSYIQSKVGVISTGIKDADIIAITNRNDEYCVQIFLYRSYQPCGTVSYFPDNTSGESKVTVLESFLLQFYQNKKPPAEIIVSEKITNSSTLIAALSALHNCRVQISNPQRGERARLMQNVLQNAEISLDNHLKISAKNISALENIQKLLALDKVPARIEIYDNSHIQGEFAVGAMVVAGQDGFNKKEYRLYTIRQPKPGIYGGDDYSMLREVMSRRLSRLAKEPERTPDLMIIDGGKGHMSVMAEVMIAQKINIPFVCMSKGIERNAGREQFHQPHQKSFTLDKNEPVMKYLQILRDEAHNFAINSHRRKRAKSLRYSSLDQIPGIGEKRKKDLLNHFGSFKAIADATISELSKVPGISKELASKIHSTIRG